MTKTLTKDQILSAEDTKTKVVEVPEWGGSVKVTTMSGFARDRFEASIVSNKGNMNTSNIRAKLVAATIVDDNGDLMFTDKDVIKLGKKSCAALDRIFEASQELNRLTDDDVEDLAKK